MMLFADRSEAGKKLAQKLETYHQKEGVIVMGLARGGVVVAKEVSRQLMLPLDVVVVRKVGAPGNEELALGAVAGEGKGVFNEELISLLGVSEEYLKKETEIQKQKVAQRKNLYLKGKNSPSPKGMEVILVDDGIATGASMKVAIESMKAQGTKKIILAVPVASKDSLEEIRGLVDEVVCLSTPALFQAVGGFYEDFSPVTDEMIIRLLQEA